MPAHMYSIQQDAPWIREPARGTSYAPSESVYSEDYEGASYYDHPDMPSIPPLKVKKSLHPSYHAHPQQQLRDNGPQIRQSRLPIFKQVRSMLQKPSASRINTGPASSIKYDEFSGDPSESGRPPHMRPSTYKSPHQTPEPTRPTPPRRLQNEPPNARSLSPVSILRDEELQQYSPQMDWDADRPPSPVSPVSDVSHDASMNPLAPSQNVSPNDPRISVIKRKPAPNRPLTSPENVPHQLTPPSRGNEFDDAQKPYNSHFSWTTMATSVAQPRPSTDTKQSPQLSENGFLPQSRFSWSTFNTSVTKQMRPESPPSPPPALPPQYRTPPVQSILSRHRPVQRLDKEVWTPPTRKASLPVTGTGTPTSARSKLTIDPRPTGNDGTGSAKKLPPPPQLLTPVSPMSHLEKLITEEQDKQQQRRNIEKAIGEYTKIENASPMDVSFTQLRGAQKKLGELRTTLAEVTLEEREIGIAISRLRRKEGEEEGLWVRRVTG